MSVVFLQSIVWLAWFAWSVSADLLYSVRLESLHNDFHTHMSSCFELTFGLGLSFSLDLWLLSVCFCHFCSHVVYFCYARFNFFTTKPRDWLGRTSPNWTILCQVGCKSSISQSDLAVTVTRFLFNWSVFYRYSMLGWSHKSEPSFHQKKHCQKTERRAVSECM